MTTLTNDQITDFLIDNYSPCFTWNREDVKKWYQWHHHFGLSEVIVDSANQILAVALARPVKKAEDGNEDYNFDPMGSCLFVDMVTLVDNRTRPQLLEAILKKMGMMKTIAFKRFKHSDDIREYPFERFMSKFIKGVK